MTTDYFHNSSRIPVEKATNFVYYAFIQYVNFFELTRDLKKHFSKLSFDKHMIYCQHFKHPLPVQFNFSFHCIQECDEIFFEKAFFFTGTFTFCGKMFHEYIVKEEGIKIEY